jgi:demethoxyubiquinone hydroxylase (CLK1/Coq7/Cat5 family)
MQTTNETKNTISHLNSFLRGELAAVETYRQALDKLGEFTDRAVLHDCLRSHEERVALLTNEIRRRGGDPAKGSGPWGAFAKLVEGGAAVFGHKAAIAALEEGEDHGRDDYRRDLKELDPQARNFIQSEILPLQNRTHGALSALKLSLS